MAKRLKEVATGDVYPWSETWAKDPRFAEIEQVEIVVPDPFVVVTDGPDESEGDLAPFPESMDQDQSGGAWDTGEETKPAKPKRGKKGR